MPPNAPSVPVRRSPRLAAIKGYRFANYSMEHNTQVRFETPEAAAAGAASFKADISTFDPGHLSALLQRFCAVVSPTNAVDEDSEQLAGEEEAAILGIEGVTLQPGVKVTHPEVLGPMPDLEKTRGSETVEDVEEEEGFGGAAGKVARSAAASSGPLAKVEWPQADWIPMSTGSLTAPARPPSPKLLAALANHKFSEGLNLPNPTAPAHGKAPSAGPSSGRREERLEAPYRRSKRASRRKPAKSHVQQIRRGGWHRTLAKDDEYRARLIRLLVRTIRSSDSFQNIAFNVKDDASSSSTGWMGRRMPTRDLNTLRRAFASGKLDEATDNFFRVPYDGKPTMLLDAEGRCFVFRTMQIPFLMHPKAQRALAIAVETLLRATMNDPRIKACNVRNPRGRHIACIMGYHRQYTGKPILEQWHALHQDEVQFFLEDPIVIALIQYVSKTMKILFPGIQERFEASAKWHASGANPIFPHFGSFWNLCINAMFVGQTRIHCLPHIDFKNIVGMCVLVVYQAYGTKRTFDHKRKSWIVMWEAGVVIELPPWVFMAYPSSLLHHWNRDMSDFQVVVTDGSLPTPENSTPLEEEGDGRATFVFFNQASMFQSSETGYDTLAAARVAGLSGTVDLGASLQEAMTNFSFLQPLTDDDLLMCPDA